MRLSYKASLVLLVGLLSFSSSALAQEGNCRASNAEAYLDINQVRARIFNNGGLFWRGDPHVYEVPRGGQVNSVFASGLWFGGQVNGETRLAATTYGPWEFWAGPLGDDGSPPANCSAFDRIYKVSRADIQAYENGAAASTDLAQWPTGLGAPTVIPAAADGVDNDEDGEVDEEGEMARVDLLSQPLASRVNRVIDLAGGERPEMQGDQMLWWVMNDRGNAHGNTGFPSVGIEVHGLAFAFNLPGAIGNSTFYRYRVFYKGTQPLTNTYAAVYADVDLGTFDDDYVGSDPELGVGFVYNARATDGQYGIPPALGYDFFQGPIVPGAATDTALQRGRKVPGFRNLDMTSFIAYTNGADIEGDPSTGSDFYFNMQGRWKNGANITRNGTGYNPNNPNAEVTKFVWSGDPVTEQFWSEVNNDGAGSDNPLGDRRFVMGSGPFVMQPGDEQEIVFGVVWSRGANRYDSITRLRADDQLAQAAFDVNFELPPPPAAPQVTATAANNRAIIEWTNPPTSNNYLNNYRVLDPFTPLELSEDERTYEFEGYIIYEYASPADTEGRVVATYDKVNGITRVLEAPAPGEPVVLTANGSDSGLRYSYIAEGLVNQKDYYFGVQGYAYNEASPQKVYKGPIAKVTVTPTKNDLAISEEALELSRSGQAVDANRADGNLGDGNVRVVVVNPARVRPGRYVVEYSTATIPSLRAAGEEAEVDPAFIPGSAKGGVQETNVIVYDIVYISEDGEREVLFDGSAYAERTGEAPPLGERIVAFDGLEFTILGPTVGYKNFLTIRNANGAINPPEYAAFAFNSSGFPHPTTGDRPDGTKQQSSGLIASSGWGFHTFGARTTFDEFYSRTTRDGSNFGEIGINDYEMRFTGSSIAYAAFGGPDKITVPFELWDIGITPNNTADDVRLIPVICESPCGAGGTDGVYDIGGDSPLSGGTDDPYTDAIYWYRPVDNSPGQAGYQAYAADMATASPTHDPIGGEIFARTVLMGWNFGSAAPYRQALPEQGTVFRIITNKTNQPNDQFVFATDSLGARPLTAEQQVAALDEIGIVPNPYRGASNYEVSQLIDEVRFTNLPEQCTPQCTLRIYTLNGTLLQTLVKPGTGRTLSWDMTTKDGLPIASGIYLIHVDVPGVGERILKFAVVKKRTQLNVF